MNKYITILFSIFFTLISSKEAHSFSWKDILLNQTTEKEIVSHIGKPWSVEMSYDDYNLIGTYKPSTKFHYGWSIQLDSIESAKKRKPHAFLKLFPLTSDYISSWSGDFHFRNHKISWYTLNFEHEAKYKNSIIEDIKTLFGPPNELERSVGMGIVTYRYDTFWILFGDQGATVSVQDYSENKK